MGSDDITRKIRNPLIRCTRLVDLNPRWISPHNRLGIGFDMDCPNEAHRGAHRVELYFLNPLDGEPVDPGHLNYYDRTEQRFERLTIARSDYHDHHITIDGHWRGSIIEGECADALGVAW